GLQTRAQPLADLQIGVEESSLPRYSNMEFGYGDLEIVRGSSGNLEIALSGMFFFFFYAPRFISYCCAWSPDQSATSGRSPDRRGRKFSTSLQRYGIWIRRSGDRPGVERQSGDCTQRNVFLFLLCSPFYQLLLRLVSRPERNPWPISKSAWKKVLYLATAIWNLDTAIWRSS